jgi:Family of unknown function (DUF5947)
MGAGVGTAGGSRLARLVRDTGARSPETAAPCEFCGAALPDEHRHVLDVERRELRCACRPCALLFDGAAAASGRLRAVGDRRLRLDGFAMTDEQWEQLRLPVDVAFLLHDTPAGRVCAYYPSPAGATESLLTLTAWQELAAANPVLATLSPDVEALLVSRLRGTRRQWLVPIDDCFTLVGLIRMQWRGLTGGKEVWLALDQYFDDLDGRARSVGREGP